MKVFQSSIFRAIIAIIVGVLLIKFRQDTMTGIIIAIGIMFFLSGLFSVIAYYVASCHADAPVVYDANGNQLTGQKPAFPVVGFGSLILGIILALMHDTFITGVMYILATILILGAISQMINLLSARKFASVGFYYWIVPCLILLIGIYIMVHPMESATAPLLVIGWCMLVYGVIELVNTLKIHSCRKSYEKAHADNGSAIEAEEIKEPTEQI